MSERQLALEAQAVHILVEALKEQGEGEEGIELSVASETNLRECIEAVYSSLLDDEALTAGIRSIIEGLVNRRLRLEHRIERRRGAIEKALIAAELHRLELPAATLSLRRVPPALQIIAESEIPADYWVSKPHLDRALLKNTLKEGRDVPGARLDNGGTGLTIRVA